MAKSTLSKTKRKKSQKTTAAAAQPRIRGLRKYPKEKLPRIRYDEHPLYNIFVWLRRGGKLAKATGECTQIPPYVEQAQEFKTLPYKIVRKNRPSKWWCYPTPNPALMEESFYRKRDNTFWQLPVIGFWTKEEAGWFLSTPESYSGPVPLLDVQLEPTDPKPVFEEFFRREGVGPPPESGFFAARSRRLAKGLDPQAISCVLSGEFEWNSVINSANGKPWHQFDGDRIKNPKELLCDIAREILEAVREVHPDMSLSCFRGVLQSWQLFDHFYDICCRLMQSDPSLDWRVVDHARDYIWTRLGRFSEHTRAAPDTARHILAVSPQEPQNADSESRGTRTGKQTQLSPEQAEELLARKVVVTRETPHSNA
jgi:hypothetical protein